jgi:hypothetical protein
VMIVRKKSVKSSYLSIFVFILKYFTRCSMKVKASKIKNPRQAGVFLN